MSTATLSSETPGPARGQWLAGPAIDLLLLIGTPLVLVPVFWMASRVLSDEMIVLGVTLFGANAHHLPGLMRAYGDPAFRRRYRARLTIAPVAIVSVCLAYFHLDLDGLLFVAFCWGIWHALAQVYGLGRMYDGRASLISTATARLDKAICIGWFVGGFLFSPHRLGLALTELYRCGVPALPPEAIIGLRWVWMTGTLLVTGAWAWNQRRLALAGEGNPIKLLLFASSFAFWWYSNIPIESAIVGVVLFEAFHDVQYLTTVWLYNRRVVGKGQRLGAFSTVLFRPGAIGIAIYVGLCFLYGHAGLISKGLLGEGAGRTIAAVVLSSLLLHFYYDSFLWNVRDPAVRDDMGLRDGVAAGRPVVPSSGFAMPGLAWAWFVIPLFTLLVVQQGLAPGDSSFVRKLAHTLPTHEKALLLRASLEFEEGRDLEALRTVERAGALHPESGDVLRQLVEAYARTGRPEQAAAALERLEVVGGVDARTLVSIGIATHARSAEAAEPFYLRALGLEPSNLEARMNLASAMLETGRRDDARTQLIEARRLAPENPAILYNLGVVELERGDLAAAAEAFGAVVRIQPGHPEAMRGLREVRARRRAGGHGSG